MSDSAAQQRHFEVLILFLVPGLLLVCFSSLLTVLRFLYTPFFHQRLTHLPFVDSVKCTQCMCIIPLAPVTLSGSVSTSPLIISFHVVLWSWGLLSFQYYFFIIVVSCCYCWMALCSQDCQTDICIWSTRTILWLLREERENEEREHDFHNALIVHLHSV